MSRDNDVFIEHQWTLTGSLSPRPSLKKEFLVGFPSPPYDGLVSSVGIGSAGGGVISKNRSGTGTQIRNVIRSRNSTRI